MIQVIDTPEGIRAYQAITLRSALKLYLKGIRVNRLYTPKRMMEATRVITSKELKARDYEGAIAALTELIEG